MEKEEDLLKVQSKEALKIDVCELDTGSIRPSYLATISKNRSGNIGKDIGRVYLKG